MNEVLSGNDKCLAHTAEYQGIGEGEKPTTNAPGLAQEDLSAQILPSPLPRMSIPRCWPCPRHQPSFAVPRSFDKYDRYIIDNSIHIHSEDRERERERERERRERERERERERGEREKKPFAVSAEGCGFGVSFSFNDINQLIKYTNIWNHSVIAARYSSGPLIRHS